MASPAFLYDALGGGSWKDKPWWTCDIRPADLFGAIANEAGSSGREIGKIEMAPGFSLVEVPESSADTVIEALADAKIRGQRLTARRER